MTIKVIQKSVNLTSENKVEEFISRGGSLSVSDLPEDHRLTLRIPKDLMNRIDIDRKKRVGRISRNLWILEALESYFQESDDK